MATAISTNASILGGGSAAPINTALTALGLPSTDERGTGFSRPTTGSIDIGAIQTQSTTATTTSISARTSSTTVGTAVTFTATVTPSSGSPAPTGTVTFIDTVGGASGVQDILGTATLTAGTATLQAMLPANVNNVANSVIAIYSGDANFTGSTSTTPQSVAVSLAAGTALFAVATAADGGTNSLSAAVTAANSQTGSTIVLSSGTFTLSQGELDVDPASGTLTIIGQGSSGPNATIINQNAFYRVLQIATGLNVTLENVEITGGLSDVDATNGSDNTSTSVNPAEGGGIEFGSTSAVNTGTLTLSNVVVTNNKSLAIPGTAADALGGGIFAAGNLVIGNNSQVIGNSVLGRLQQHHRRRQRRRRHRLDRQSHHDRHRRRGHRGQ